MKVNFNYSSYGNTNVVCSKNTFNGYQLSTGLASSLDTAIKTNNKKSFPNAAFPSYIKQMMNRNYQLKCYNYLKEKFNEDFKQKIEEKNLNFFSTSDFYYNNSISVKDYSLNDIKQGLDIYLPELLETIEQYKENDDLNINLSTPRFWRSVKKFQYGGECVNTGCLIPYNTAIAQGNVHLSARSNVNSLTTDLSQANWYNIDEATLRSVATDLEYQLVKKIAAYCEQKKIANTNL